MKHLKNPAAQFSLAYRLGYQANRNQEPITNILQNSFTTQINVKHLNPGGFCS